MRASASSHEAKKAAETVSIVLARAGEVRRAQGHQYDTDDIHRYEQQGSQGVVPVADPLSADGNGAGRVGVLPDENSTLGSTVFDRE
jgi:hypothetical protein